MPSLLNGIQTFIQVKNNTIICFRFQSLSQPFYSGFFNVFGLNGIIIPYSFSRFHTGVPPSFVM
jgi:hypothetical protein